MSAKFCGHLNDFGVFVIKVTPTEARMWSIDGDHTAYVYQISTYLGVSRFRTIHYVSLISPSLS